MATKLRNEDQSPPSPARIFIGGLGAAVNADELRRVFELCGGAVDSIDFVRTKGRSFAYVDFSPSAHNSLSNLFAKYNGCVWKGGKLKLEKAKEHYEKRFAREKAEEADADAPRPSSEVPQNSLTEPDKKAIRVFFPALRKVKLLPLSGTGKHKYSFQRIDLSIRPKYFCDCEEHSGPTERGKQICQVEAKSDGVTGEEFDIMNKVMNTLFEKKNQEVTEADNDDLVINVVSKENHKVDSFTTHDQRAKRAWPQETSNETPSKKMKQFPPNHGIGDELKSSGLNSKRNSQDKSDKSSKSQLTADVSRPQKPSWKELLTDTSSSAFRIASDEAPDSEAEVSRPQKPSWKELLADSSRSTFRIASDDAPDSDKSESDALDSDEEIEDLVTDSELEEEKTDSDGEVDKCESDESESDGIIEECESDEKESDGEIEECESDRELEEEEKTDSDGEVEECESDRELEEKEKTDSDEEVEECESDEKESDGEIKECESERELEEEKTEMELETVPTENTQGASWMQKCSWTQLVGQNSSFSISEPVPGTTSARPIITSFGHIGKKKLKESSNPAKQCDPSVSEVATEDDLSTKTDLKDDEQSIICNNSSAPVRISPLKVEISDTCNFMRTATSLKEWSKTKSAISGSRKRKANATGK